MAEPCLLVGDIGGTNARFALADKKAPGFSDPVTLQCADYERADAAIKDYLKSVGAPPPNVICLAVAGPIVEQCVHFTNNAWSISANELAADFSVSTVQLLNDFEAIAYSIPFLADDACLPVGLSEPTRLDDEQYTLAIIGPGTGLGMAGLRKYGSLLIPIAGEGSHSGFAPESQVQLDILIALRERFDRVSAERLISGPGLENIYWALAPTNRERQQQLSAAEIFANASDESDPRATQAVDVFFEVFGQLAGDLALTLGVDKGVYLAGGITQRYPRLLNNSRFRSGFENKGRYRSLLERIPTQLILHEQPGLLGASYLALKMLGPTSEIR